MPTKFEISDSLFKRQTPLFLAIYHDLVNSDIIGELCNKLHMGRDRLTKAIAFHIYSERRNRGSFAFLTYQWNEREDMTPASELVTRQMRRAMALSPEKEIGYNNEQIRAIKRNTVNRTLYAYRMRMLEVKDGVL
jgi:hypothetical protein